MTKTARCEWKMSRRWKRKRLPLPQKNHLTNISIALIVNGSTWIGKFIIRIGFGRWCGARRLLPIFLVQSLRCTRPYGRQRDSQLKCQTLCRRNHLHDDALTAWVHAIDQKKIITIFRNILQRVVALSVEVGVFAATKSTSKFYVICCKQIEQ